MSAYDDDRLGDLLRVLPPAPDDLVARLHGLPDELGEPGAADDDLAAGVEQHEPLEGWPLTDEPEPPPTGDDARPDDDPDDLWT